MDHSTTNGSPGAGDPAPAALTPPPSPVPPYRDGSALARWSARLLGVSAAVAAVALVSDVMVLGYLLGLSTGGIRYDQATASATDMRQVVISVLTILMLIATAVVFLMWVYRASTNARALGAMGMQYTPARAVVWWFVPIASLVIPYRVMHELWRASASPRGWDATSRRIPLLSWWWALWIISSIAGNLIARLSASATTLDSLIAASVAVLFVDVLTIAAAVLAIGVVRTIDRMQHDAAQMGLVAA